MSEETLDAELAAIRENDGVAEDIFKKELEDLWDYLLQGQLGRVYEPTGYRGI